MDPVVVTWVLDANSKYEISSKEHLIQLMNDGTVYANTGSIPSTPLKNNDYIQTVDIDLLGDSTNIAPIGSVGAFSGEYDGNGFTVSNWNYVDPFYPSQGGGNEYNHVGFFGYIQNGTVKNFRMAGVCSLTGFKNTGGMVSGWVIQSSTLSNIEVDLSPGSYITQSNSATATWTGPVLGRIDNTGTITGLIFKGTIDSITYSTGTTSPVVGGVVGYMKNSSGTNTLFRNLGTFTAPLRGSRVGGVVGQVENSNLTKVLNAMTGDITETKAGSYIGGVVGQLSQNSVSLTNNEFVNSMKGNITGTTTNSYNGGVVGYMLQTAGSTVHSFMNYMAGSITNTFNADRVGGLVASANANLNLTTSINAMNGYVRMPTNGSPSSGADANIDTSFGLTYDIERNITTSPIGLSLDSGVGLPIFDLSATDPDGVTHAFVFVFGNLPPPSFSTRPGAINIKVDIDAVPGAVALKLTYQAPTGSESTAFSGFLFGPKNIKSLDPEVEYTLRLYVDSGSGYEMAEEQFVSTVANSADNYVVDDFVEDGKIKLDGFDAASRTNLSAVMNELFTTGDKINVQLGGKKSMDAKFVNRGATTRVDASEALLLPFDAGAGSAQTINLQLSDDSTTAVVYDEVANTVSVESVVYSPGDSFLIDAQKCIIVEY